MKESRSRERVCVRSSSARENERGSKVAGVCQVSKLSGQVTAPVMTSSFSFSFSFSFCPPRLANDAEQNFCCGHEKKKFEKMSVHVARAQLAIEIKAHYRDQSSLYI